MVVLIGGWLIYVLVEFRGMARIVWGFGSVAYVLGLVIFVLVVRRAGKKKRTAADRRPIDS